VIVVLLAEVGYFGQFFHPPVNEHYLDLCRREGLTHIVEPANEVTRLRLVVILATY